MLFKLKHIKYKNYYLVTVNTKHSTSSIMHSSPELQCPSLSVLSFVRVIMFTLSFVFTRSDCHLKIINLIYKIKSDHTLLQNIIIESLELSIII